MNVYTKLTSLKCWVVILPLFVLTACGTRKASFNPSSVEPAARGQVKVKKDKNKNYGINVSVRNLAGPDRLPLAKNAYVVWMEGENGVQNIGQLRPSEGLFSKTIKASLQTSSPYKPNRIFITAEDASTVQYPGNYIVLATKSF